MVGMGGTRQVFTKKHIRRLLRLNSLSSTGSTASAESPNFTASTSSFHRNDLERHTLAAAKDDDLVFLAGFHVNERVGVIVNISNIAAC